MLRAVLAVLAGGVGLGVAASGTASAAVAFDSFESDPLGGLDGRNGGSGWSGAWAVGSGRASAVNVVELSLSYSGGEINVSGGSQALALTGLMDSDNLLSRPFASQAGPVYFSFLYRTTSVADEDFMQFGVSNTGTAEPKLSAGTANNASGNAAPPRFFTRVGSGTENTIQSTQTLQADVTYLMVAKVTKTSGSANYNSIALYVNPTTLDESLATPLVSKTGSSGPGLLNHFILRTARTGDGDVYYIDNLTIGTSFSEVVPEPTGLLALGAGAMALCSRRRSV